MNNSGSFQLCLQQSFCIQQKCSPGFYRENSGLFRGRCLPCNCNGNSDRCLDGSGICVVSNNIKHCWNLLQFLTINQWNAYTTFLQARPIYNLVYNRPSVFTSALFICKGFLILSRNKGNSVCLCSWIEVHSSITLLKHLNA